jgi:hypothetical protein
MGDIVMANVQEAAHVTSDHKLPGLNDLLRQVLYPGFPPGECIDGYVFFPGGTGPTFPIFCDRDAPLFFLKKGAGSQFVTKAGSGLAAAAAELAGIGREEAEKAVAKAAGIEVCELKMLSVRNVGRKIVKRASELGKARYVEPSCDETVGTYFDMLGKTIDDIDPAKAIGELSRQTGLPQKKLRALPLAELGDVLDVAGVEPGEDSPTALQTVVCFTGGGNTSCVRVHGWLEGAVLGGFIGGWIGGAVGAAIGAVIGAILGWLF